MRSFFFLVSLLVFVSLRECVGVPLSQFYPYGEDAGDQKLRNEDEGATSEIELRAPFVYFGETYFSLFVNANGIISFLTEIPYFFNAQFPLDYPIIAPFYSDVDTSGTGNVYYRETSDPKTIGRVTSQIHDNFASGHEFRPTSVFLTTWDKVGAYQGRVDKTNTYQVVLATNSRDSYVVFQYPEGGVQWLQGDGKTSGLPDAIGQAGFIAADGRVHALRGSGTDQVRNLDKWSNVGEPGVWMFRVGKSTSESGVQEPDQVGGFLSLDGQQGSSYASGLLEDSSSCAAGGSVCHSQGVCHDYEGGFCCACNRDHHGNGLNCLKKDTPIRVTGTLRGHINGISIAAADLHSYVLPSDGRTYTAVSMVPSEVGYDLQSLTGIGEGIAWLFATPADGVTNGFGLSGALLNRTVKVKFPQTGHTAFIEQTFQGLDVFNNIAVDTELKGSVPTVPVGSELEVDAFSEEFTRVKNGQLRAHSSRNFRLKGQRLETPYSVETIIFFNECEHAPRNPEMDTLRMKVAENIFIRFDETESIVRYSFSAKVGTLEEEDPCLKGREECGENSQCIVDGDNYRCVCEPGYDHVFDETLNAPICLDLNECAVGRDNCHANAVCINSPGSYSCQCQAGFTGDGRQCTPELSCSNAGCAENALCREINQVPECECSVGYKGDGFFCIPDFGEDSCHIAQNCSPYAVCSLDANGYVCRCLPGYRGDGYECNTEGLGYENGYKVPIDEQTPEPVYPEPLPTFAPYNPYQQPDIINTNVLPETVQPECLLEVCWCPQGYDYDRTEGICKEVIGYSQNTHEEGSNPSPSCHEEGKCVCPSGYLYSAIYGRCDSLSEAPSCNVMNNCHTNAHCMYQRETGESHCTCNTGYVGNGFFCSPIEVSCDQVYDLCHFNADCIYDDIQLRSVCVCKPGFSGDGLSCTPQDNCNSNTDCDANAQCQFESSTQRYTCKCNDRFEGDGFFCSAFEERNCVSLNNCHRDAECEYDTYIQNYECKCRHGFDGDGYLCLKIEEDCNSLNNCDQNAECRFNPSVSGYVCQCHEGYTGDGFFCQQIQTCLSDPTFCPPNSLCQRISSDEYDHECICITGYIRNGHSCDKAPDHERNILLINQGLSVLRMDIDSNSGNGYPIHVVPYMTAVGADVDCLAGLYYWTDVGSRSIRSSKYDGNDRKPVITGGEIGSPEDVAVDWVSKNIYWTDSKNDVVSVADTEGKLLRTVVKGDLVNPRGLTLHPGLGVLFWSDWNRDKPKIEKAGLDGSEREVLVSGEDVSLPNSLVVDFKTSTLCWADAGTHRLECIGIQGYGRRVIVEGVKYPFGLTLHKQSFFYTDWNDTRIYEVSKYDGAEQSVRVPPPGGSGKLYGIAAVPEQCPSVSNVCQHNRGHCPDTHLCLPNGNGGRTCACPDRTLRSGEDEDEGEGEEDMEGDEEKEDEGQGSCTDIFY